MQPVRWLFDEKVKIAVTENLIFAGVQFNHSNQYDGNFENTDIKKFMDNYFAKELKASQLRREQVNVRELGAPQAGRVQQPAQPQNQIGQELGKK